jgi:hypothetical protein
MSSCRLLTDVLFLEELAGVPSPARTTIPCNAQRVKRNVGKKSTANNACNGRC